MLLQKDFEFRHAVNRHAADHAADQVGLDVEHRQRLKAPLRKARIPGHGLTDVARADDDHIVFTAQTQNAANMCPQLRHVVAVALLTQRAEAVDVLTNL